MKKLCFLFLLFVSARLLAQEWKQYPMWNPSLPIEQRVNDVVSRLTLEEKVAQMLNATPAVPRLGIPAYDWWNEVLHGVARTPYRTTVFPQAIAMAATWDTNSLYRMADYSALEGRAIHNKAIESGRTKERYLGLTYWTPNINIFRDPRWGRGQETYGEDPFLTAMLGRAFVRGLQGEDDKYLKAAACAKHFAVHSGPEPSRHSDNFNPTTYDLWDTYLPAFKELIVDANVVGVMCAYNAVNKQPCCGNDLLMNDILRNQWKFNGYVTSDCWAIDDFFKYHKTHPDATSAAVDAVLHGTDIECGQTVYYTLKDAVQKGLITEAQLDVSLKRLFTVRYKLGMFDPVSMVKYAQTPSSVLESAPHQAHALKMAQQSVVLLKNDKQTLPLQKNIKKVAVVGPNADNRISVLGNYNGVPSRIVTVLDGIKEKLGPGVEVIYEKGVNFTNDTLLAYSDLSKQFTYNNASGFQAEYFAGRELEGNPVFTRVEPTLDLTWQRGDIIGNGLTATNFSARFNAVFKPAQTGKINLEVNADDGYRLFVNGKKVIDAWTRNRWGARTYALDAKKDSSYKITLEYWQGDDQANVSLRTGNFKKTDHKALAARLAQADVIIFAGGISPQLEGEEMPVNDPGFDGGDRTTIQLPVVQTELLKALKATGKPLVFVMMTGSAIAIPWEDKNVPAIVNAWYGGQSAGTAIADVLFGDYNPAGRLPVTFYASDKDIPGFSDYTMNGRTYRYFKGKALYPFGYGLSYTNFKYADLKLPSGISSGKELPVTVTLTNTGSRDGEEVIQLYVAHQGVKGKAPIRALKGFKRVFLKAGETATFDFTLKADDLSLVKEADGSRYIPSGKVQVSVGGGQPGERAGSGNVVSGIVSIQ
ncbi:glycoside hydrolase family 3 C-terminal domain-containing protein [Parasegetibacter sp. NRK P23]|uniref:glycoside hydrolase family 3 C-terminal domain-containing protein n=1 Tax=Parasegetibacter sp. NRK P23 TaxID=2942999 RepID=UPI002044AA99|nr:glycoside hydrolase family 3 C-terminal domain-containing protein [Parasegetibacter sp. NRK P23]MCM5529226.1 glycoside hydrolase family 3 C-terminal domain-containing protein [Parasegetibacter sp. NRK P23]